MSDIIHSLEAIRDGLKAKIDTLPEVVALKRVEASILEISSLLNMISKQTLLAVPVAQVQRPVNTQSAPAQAQQEKSQAQSSAVPISQPQPLQAQGVINEAQFEEELSKLLVHKAA
jgi:hypothetical protein